MPSEQIVGQDTEEGRDLCVRGNEVEIDPAVIAEEAPGTLMNTRVCWHPVAWTIFRHVLQRANPDGDARPHDIWASPDLKMIE